MKVAFRTDASNQIGTGHFMRCLTLAEGLKKQGADIRFISRDLPAHLSDILNTKSIELIPLSVHDLTATIDELAHASWLGVNQAQDAKASIDALFGQEFDWIVVDHYALDLRFVDFLGDRFWLEWLGWLVILVYISNSFSRRSVSFLKRRPM